MMIKTWKDKKEFIEHIRNRRLKLSRSQEDISLQIGMSQSYIQQIERNQGRVIPSIPVLVKLAEIYGEDPKDYLSVCMIGVDNGKNNVENLMESFIKEKTGDYGEGVGARLVPVLTLAQCEGWENLSDLEYPMSKAEARQLAPTKDSDAFFVAMEGDSMAPRIEPGDLVLVEPNVDAESGDIVFARANDQCVIRKLHIESDGKILLLAVNPDYPPILIMQRRSFKYYKASKRLSDL